MNAALTWAELGKEHLSALQNFVCTDPPKPEVSAATGWVGKHPRMYEYDAQQVIRSMGKKWRLPPECSTIVGSDAEGVAVVSAWTELDGPDWVHLDVMGVAQRLRLPGEENAAKRVGTACMQETLRRIEQKAIEAGARRMNVEGEIYRENWASLRMVEHFGFTYITEAPTGTQTWALEYLFPVDI